ncbi:hypothetical protein JCM8115_000502 [Rhodotorula mucilaginosa]
MKFAALAAAAALFGASTVSASAAVHGHQDVAARQAVHRRGADRIQRLTKPLLAVQNSTSTSTDALSTTAIWWAEDGWTGSCGVKIDNNANTVGLPLSLYPNADAQSSLCGQTAYAVNPSTGESVSVVVVDGSDRSEYATFSKAAYLALGGNLDTGMLPITLSLSPAAAKAVVADASSASSLSSASSAKSATSVVVASSASSVRSSTSSVSSAAATAAPTTTKATTTAAPTTTTQDQAALAAAASSSKAFENQQSLQLAAQASSSSQAAAAYAASQAAASQAAASQAAASQAAAASAAAAAEASQAAASQAAEQAAAAAAASEASADAAWASSSSAAAAAAAKATQGASSGGGSGNVYSGGIATFFYQNGIAGNCGNVNSDNTLLVALPTATYAGGSHCGQYVEITRSDTGNKIKALVADSCPTCNNNSCLDLSWGAFSALGGTQSMGVFDITWQFV